MKKDIKGIFTQLDGQQVYKIENYDQMENFFMTITSSSDAWNFCWSYGGITAGRVDSNHAVFPYYTADKVSDAASYTGNYTCIETDVDGEKNYWEPFASLHNSPSSRKISEKNITRSIYKNFNGTQVWFEEKNNELNLTFRTSWTSSDKYGIVRSSVIENNGDKKCTLRVLDGCQNILPACVTSDFQNSNSILLDAYKKTDLDENANLALFSVSSIVSDKAEPNEGLYANTCWFSTEDKLILDTDAPQKFAAGDEIIYPVVSKGKRSSCFICRNVNLENGASEKWYQVFDTSLTLSKVAQLRKLISSRKSAEKDLEMDVKKTDELMTSFISMADGIQHTNEKMTCLHHQQNVMFNIMRGGIFADNGNIIVSDFIIFVYQRNRKLSEKAETLLKNIMDKTMNYQELMDIIQKTGDNQLIRMFLEYMPVTFSRRHGDPSRPWNIFAIKLKDENGKQILNYQGNWRDIFQNWEALSYSYPVYIKNMCVKFLNAMTIEGFNPYKINRDGVDWEIPDPNNPWAQIGYWGDHQVIYLEKLLEFYEKTNHSLLMNSLDEKIYTSANVPYRLKGYKEILENPRSTILFDKELSAKLLKDAKEEGGDAKLVKGKDGNPELVSFTAKLLQIVIAKAANLIPGGGIWLNTQRPEWNDANNALAGYGLSVVTTCYLHRYISFLISTYSNASGKMLSVPATMKECLESLKSLYTCENENEVNAICNDSKKRKAFTDKAGEIFQKERDEFYALGYSKGMENISADEIVEILSKINMFVEETVKLNRRADGLYHSYNTAKFSNDGIEIVYLQEMLEGQVAVLSSGMLSPEETLEVIHALENSAMYEPRQSSYMLYPNKELLPFQKKNCVSPEDAAKISSLTERTGTMYLEKDSGNVWHFNADFRNLNVMKDFIAKQSGTNKPSADELNELFALYEKTFNHQSFTGRSGTFYAYEGLGSIYWHMVSKLLLAVQENIFIALNCGKKDLAEKLTESYYRVRSGLSFNKTPEVYGAFPQDPYSHTPYHQGAKQPGMTGQVKEEILTRWGELGLDIAKGSVSFNPIILKPCELNADHSLSFTWCGVPVEYTFTESPENSISVNGKERKGCSLTEEESASVFARNGKIKDIKVFFAKNAVRLCK